jgi:Icc-related predicted phosphoesterase
VIAGGDEPSGESLGTSLVLCPGRLDQGRYALVDFHNSTVEFGSVAARASV